MAVPDKILKTDEEWQKLLPEDVFEVTRKHGTERPFSGQYCMTKQAGLYSCICCGLELFDGTSKFESGTGWPSFTQAVEPEHIREISDRSYGMLRTEIRCAACDAHLGHVFPDGPPPTYQRFCLNSLALKFTPDE